MSLNGSTDTSGSLDGSNAKDVRNQMHTYWKRYSDKGDVNEMFVDSQADELAPLETQEIMSSIPNFEGKDVLELASGIGRFTGKLSDKAKSVISIDFTEMYVEKNKEVNGHRSNVTIWCMDVMNLDLPNDSLDVILTNWLMQYLSLEDIGKLLKRMIRWLRPDGRLFFRDSCMRNAHRADKHLPGNPTFYRPPYEYADIFRSVTQERSNGIIFGLDIILTKSLDTYIRIKNDPNQNCWLLGISERHGDEQQRQTDALKKSLDENIYPSAEIQCLEEVFGEGFVSLMIPNEELNSMLDLKKGQSLLEVGCGTGGSAIRLSQNSAVNITGIDLSSNMVSIANERLKENKVSNVGFEVGDVRTAQFEIEEFDAIYSNDGLCHVERKDLLFMDFLKWIKSDGKVIFVDHVTCRQPESLSLEFRDFIKIEQLYYLTTDQYILELRKAGFSNVRAIDKTEAFIQQMKDKLDRFVDNKEVLSKKYSQRTIDAVQSCCDDKLRKCVEGDLRWTIFYAEKATTAHEAKRSH